MRITETMPAGRIIQVFAKVRSRIYEAGEKHPMRVILSAAKNLKLFIHKALKDSSVALLTQNDTRH